MALKEIFDEIESKNQAQQPQVGEPATTVGENNTVETQGQNDEEAGTPEIKVDQLYKELLGELEGDDDEGDDVVAKFLQSFTQPQQPQQQVIPQPQSPMQQPQQPINQQPIAPQPFGSPSQGIPNNDLIGVIGQVVSQQLQPFIQQMQMEKTRLEVEELAKEIPSDVLAKYSQQLIQAKQSNPYLSLKQLANLVIPRAEWERLGAMKVLEKLKERITPSDANPKNNENVNTTSTQQERYNSLDEAVKRALGIL